MSNSVILKANNINKSFRSNEKVTLEILKSISLDVEENKISVIVGASGAGKSTLLHILGGLDKPDSGEVIFNSTNIYNLTDDKLARFRNNNIGFVFQFHHLLPEFTALENIMIPQMINGVPEKKASMQAKDLLNEIGLIERVNHKPAELSGGEQQRVAVARALANDPEIILADEPTGNLDSQNSIILQELFTKLKNKLNKTFIIVTHNRELMFLGDNLFEMKDGTIYKNNELKK
ncbi:MAG: ABC transporter ATP-binding protein [Ignavibacteria bacterium GWB2_36_8]|nr:MAG: ABC transporter ATP-binding protein [Ignavibacteria bacterium GWB2_36_8]OGU51872.1 MAG: ABC transporter ATP-binding protein [Ignavibacteria bacterium GWC2_36_12]OGV01283.1 MAG: ABC transporter ATP-binding protein [Ignavibacteria bacterium RIFOXYB2_FULL_36_7]OGV25841.1 MAG: ABC transporter ATP-binding protein [Ignavibacteria bacterium RIFOXYA2_FULL_37_17]